MGQALGEKTTYSSLFSFVTNSSNGYALLKSDYLKKLFSLSQRFLLLSVCQMS